MISTKCWSCKHSVPSKKKKQGCEWSVSLKPVPGWLAEYKPILIQGRMVESYCVITCPKFERAVYEIAADEKRAKEEKDA